MSEQASPPQINTSPPDATAEGFVTFGFILRKRSMSLSEQERRQLRREILALMILVAAAALIYWPWKS
jgi:hypothetical protein